MQGTQSAKPQSHSSHDGERDGLSPQEWVRHPGDLIRVGVASVAALLTLIVLQWGPRMAGGLQEDVDAVLPDIPPFVQLVLYSTYAVVLVAAPVAMIVWIVYRRLWRLVGLGAVATAVAAGLFLVLNDWVSARVPSPATPQASTGSASTWDFQNFAWVAAFASCLTVSRPWMTRRWHRFGWVLLLSLPVLRLFIDAGAPTGRVFALAVGWLIGSLVLAVLGAPTYAPAESTVLSGLAAAGCGITDLHPARVDARGSLPFIATATDGGRVFVKVVSRDQRDADLLFRVYRFLRLRSVGDEAPFSTLRRAVEHEAMVAVWAQRAGVRTPEMIACVALPDGSMALVYEFLPGHGLDQLRPDRMTDDLLGGVWEQVHLLRRARIAHRDLRRANILVTPDDEPVIIDFGFSEVSATDDLLDADVVQLIMATALEVGAQRAVMAAVTVLGPEAVRRAAPRMQTAALSSATRKALSRRHGLADEVLQQVQSQTGLGAIELVDVQRISLRRIMTAALAFAAVWFLIPVVMQLPHMADQLKAADWFTAGAAIGIAMLAFPAAALTLIASVSTRLPYLRVIPVAFAATMADQIGPVRVGSMAVNLRFLQKSGVPTAVATASIALYSVVGLVTHILLLIMFSIWAGSVIDLGGLLPGRTLLIGAALLFGVLGAALLVPRVRTYLREKLAPQAASVRESLAVLGRQPVRLILLVLGTVIMLMSSVGALDASVRAMGGDVALPVVAVLFLVGATLAGAAPTPGGLGAVEVVLIGGLTAAGTPNEVAVPAVFLYRLATLWLPALLGWIALLWLRRRDLL